MLSGRASTDFTNTNPNFTNVTFEIVDGQLVINPISVIVTITEHSDAVDYDGDLHTVTGYDVSVILRMVLHRPAAVLHLAAGGHQSAPQGGS